METSADGLEDSQSGQSTSQAQNIVRPYPKLDAVDAT
jgi:hypothetical protein